MQGLQAFLENTGQRQAEGPWGNTDCGNIEGSSTGGMSKDTWFAALGEDIF
jgi:hypothetical protein